MNVFMSYRTEHEKQQLICIVIQNRDYQRQIMGE